MPIQQVLYPQYVPKYDVSASTLRLKRVIILHIHLWNTIVLKKIILYHANTRSRSKINSWADE